VRSTLVASVVPSPDGAGARRGDQAARGRIDDVVDTAGAGDTLPGAFNAALSRREEEMAGLASRRPRSP